MTNQKEASVEVRTEKTKASITNSGNTMKAIAEDRSEELKRGKAEEIRQIWYDASDESENSTIIQRRNWRDRQKEKSSISCQRPQERKGTRNVGGGDKRRKMAGDGIQMQIGGGPHRNGSRILQVSRIITRSLPIHNTPRYPITPFLPPYSLTVT